MPGYQALTTLLEYADQFGEHAVIRDVAYRAGLLWTCVNPRCGRDNVGPGGTCECGWPAPDPEPRPGEWRCACQRVNLDRFCPSCHRENPYFRSAQLYQ